MLAHVARRPIVRNIGKLMIGAGLGQVITMLTAPIITRIYGPESFGEQSALLAVVGPLTTLTSMAFPIAIVVAQNDRDVAILSKLAFWGSALFASLIALALAWNNYWFMDVLGLGELGSYVFLVPVLAVLFTEMTTAGYIMTRYSAFTRSAKSAVLAPMFSSGSKIGLGMVYPEAIMLIIGNIIGYIVAPMMALRIQRQHVVDRSRVTIKEAVATARRYNDFALLRAPQNFIVAVSQSLPIMGLTAGFGAATAGHYAIAIALVGAPATLLGNSVQSVLYPRLTEVAQGGGDASRLLISSTLGLFAVGLPIFLPIMLFGAPLFEWVLGAEWREAGVFAALLAPWLWFGQANRPAVSLIPALKLQGGLLIYELFSTGTKVLALFVGLRIIQDAHVTIGLFSLAGSVAYLSLILWVIAVSRKQGAKQQRHGEAS